MLKTTKAKVIILIVFSFICIFVTLMMIVYKNIDIGGSEGKSNDNNDNINGENYSGIDLNGTYNQNDLKIEEKNVQNEKVNVKYYELSGLKDKNIQEKINNNMQSTIFNCYKEKVKDLTEIKNINIDTEIMANYGNTISLLIEYNITIADNVEDSYENSFTLNYDLTTGEKITLDKLFNENAPIENILRNTGYYSIIANNVEDTLSGDLRVTDYGNIEEDLIYLIDSYKKGEIKDFYYTTSYIKIFFNSYKMQINMNDWAEYICIYNRYLTDESIFESNDIGFKNLYTLCDRKKYKHYYQNYQKENNYYILITLDYYENLEGYDEREKKVVDEKIKAIEKEIERTKKLADDNKDNYYIINYYITVGRYHDDVTFDNYVTIIENGNGYNMSVNDFAEKIEPIIKKSDRQEEKEIYIYNFSDVLHLEPQQTTEYYNLVTGEKEVP